MQEFIEIQRDAVEAANMQLEKARIKLRTAMQESKTQEKLRERAFEEFIREENAREAKEVDELVSYTYSAASAGRSNKDGAEESYAIG